MDGSVSIEKVMIDASATDDGQYGFLNMFAMSIQVYPENWKGERNKHPQTRIVLQI
jgi:hypothetical protein